uniref:Uncharacterized protein n=1 Tax=Strigamia maritima TaxID=126957 RepID=T1ITG7_STRMM
MAPTKFLNTYKFTKNQNANKIALNKKYKIKHDQKNVFKRSNRRLHPKKGSAYKFLWILLISLSALICLYQIYDRFSFYLSRPIDTKVSLIRNSSVKFPSITLCPQYGNYMPLLDLRMKKAKEKNLRNFCKVDVFSLLNKKFNIFALWNLMSINGTLETVQEVSKSKIFKAITKANISQKLPLFSVDTGIKTMLGTCYTYSFKNLVRFQNDDFMLLFKLHKSLPLCSPRIVLLFILHNDDDTVTYKAFSESKTVINYKTAVYGLSAKRFKMLNQTKTPCETNQAVNECEKNCFENALKNTTSCRLPMTSVSKIPICANEKDARVTYMEILNLATIFNYKKICKCPKVCDEIVYTGHFKMIEKSDAPVLAVYFDNNVIEDIEEYYSYSFIAFISDVGGNLGLFLGLSIPTMIQLGKFIHFKKCTIRKKAKKLAFIKPYNTKHANKPIPNSKKKGFVYNPLWILLISLSALTCSYQTYDRFSSYLSRPINTKVKLIRNESVKFASVTICTHIALLVALPNGTRDISTVLDLVSVNKTLKIALEFSRSKLLKVLSGIKISLLDPPLFSVKTDTKTILGTCNTYSYKNLVRFQKDDFILAFAFHNLSPFTEKGTISFMLHDDGDIVTYKAASRCKQQKPILINNLYGLSAKRVNFFNFFSFSSRIPLIALMWYQHFDTTIKQWKYRLLICNISLMHVLVSWILNQTKKQCDTNQVVHECENNCFENALKNISRCRLPLTSLSTIPLCDNDIDSLIAYRQLYSLSVSFNYFKECNCPKICDEMIYTDHFKMTDEYPEPVLGIYFDDNVIEEIEEYYSYDLISFICDFGGNLGLFLDCTCTNNQTRTKQNKQMNKKHALLKNCNILVENVGGQNKSCPFAHASPMHVSQA